jgi:hypothetical protein
MNANIFLWFMAIVLVASTIFASAFVVDHRVQLERKKLKDIQDACFDGGYILNNVGSKYICINLGRFSHEDARHD